MAQLSGFFRANLVDGSYDRSYTAEMFAKYFATFIGNGIFAKSDMLVVHTASNGMKINVAAGQAFINGFWYDSDAMETITLDIADGTNDRVDAIVIRWSNVNRDIKLAVKKGIPSAVPITPELTRDTNTYELCIATVLIRKGISEIAQYDITDTRLDKNVCGTVGALVEQWDMTEYGNQLNQFISDYMSKADTDYTQTKQEITTWVNEVRAIVEANELDLTSVSASVVNLSKQAEFTYIVTDNTTLKNWADNIAGNDYTRVLIKAGNYDISRQIFLSKSGTKYVRGEAGNEINSNISNSDANTICSTFCLLDSKEMTNDEVNAYIESTELPKVEGVYVQLISSNITGFEMLKVVDCKVTGIGNGGQYGFFGCRHLERCIADTVYQGYDRCLDLNSCSSHMSFAGGFCYNNCKRLTNCSGSNNSYGTKIMYDFYKCEDLVNCNASGTKESAEDIGYIFGFHTCKKLTNCNSLEDVKLPEQCSGLDNLLNVSVDEEIIIGTYEGKPLYRRYVEFLIDEYVSTPYNDPSNRYKYYNFTVVPSSSCVKDIIRYEAFLSANNNVGIFNLPCLYFDRTNLVLNGYIHLDLSWVDNYGDSDRVDGVLTFEGQGIALQKPKIRIVIDYTKNTD